MSLKTIYLDGSSGLTAKLNEAFDLGRRFLLPQYDDLALPDTVTVSSSGSTFSVSNSPTVQKVNAGYSVSWDTNGVARSATVASSPAPTASAFSATVNPWTLPIAINSFVFISGTKVRINLPSGGSLGGVTAGDSVTVAGSAVSANNGTWLVTAVGAGAYIDVSIAGSSASNNEDPSSATITTASTSNKALRYSSAVPSTYTALAAELASAAAAGKTVFSVSIETSDNPAYLRLNGSYLKAYLAGIYYALDQEGIYNTYEVALSLDTSDCLSTKIKFSFVLGVAPADAACC